MSTILRVLSEADLDFAHDLSRLAGWNQTRRDWKRFQNLGQDGCFLAEQAGRPAGTATTICYGVELAWIGMVLVHPDFRRRGIGTELLRRALSYLENDRGVACVRLDATPEGRPLYEGIGFRAEWGLRRWVLDEPGNSKENEISVPVALSPGAFTLDRLVFGRTGPAY